MAVYVIFVGIDFYKYRTITDKINKAVNLIRTYTCLVKLPFRKVAWGINGLPSCLVTASERLLPGFQCFM